MNQFDRRDICCLTLPFPQCLSVLSLWTWEEYLKGFQGAECMSSTAAFYHPIDFRAVEQRFVNHSVNLIPSLCLCITQEQLLIYTFTNTCKEQFCACIE